MAVINGLEETTTHATDAASTGFLEMRDRLGEVGDKAIIVGDMLRDSLGRPITIPIGYSLQGNIPFQAVETTAKGVGEARQFASASDEAKKAQIESFLARNTGDYARITSALSISAEEVRRLGFEHGTGGKYVDFGDGELAMLHGRERVMTESEGEAETSSFAEMNGRLASIEDLLSRMPRSIFRAVRDGAQLSH